MNKQSGTQSVRGSYLGLRRTIGFIGLLLPFVLLLGRSFIQGPEIEGSISSYYYTAMGGVFVGSLCAMGVFLLWYDYHKHDHVAAILAGFLGLASYCFRLLPPALKTASKITSRFSQLVTSCRRLPPG
jgi:hypothetical protein